MELKNHKETWDESFEEQIERQAFNTAPVGDLVRSVSYYLRERYSLEDQKNLSFLEMGCGAAPTLVWLAKKGIKVSGIDISPKALELGRANLIQSGCEKQILDLREGSVCDTKYDAESFDGILESCVFQHLNKEDRIKAFQEVSRILKPGGLFVGHMLGNNHTIYKAKKETERSDDPGTLILQDGTSKIHLSDIGLAHFFSKEEYSELLKGFTTVDPCLAEYYLPKEQAKLRGYEEYLQSMWIVYAIK